MGQKDLESDDRRSHLERTIRKHMPAPLPGLELPVLQDRADRLLGALSAINAFVLEYDGTGRILYASPEIEPALGFTPEEMFEPEALEFHPDDIPVIIATGSSVRETGKPARCESRVRHKSGHWVWTECSLLGWSPSAGGNYHTLAIVREITARKTAEAARRESDERYRVITEMSCDLILESDIEGQLVYIGPTVEQIIGFSHDETMAMGRFGTMHPDDVDRVLTLLKKAFADEAEAAANSDFVRPKPQLMEYRLQHRDGRWLNFETLGLVYRKAGGEAHFLAVGRDVTDRKLAEQAREELAERMQQAQKLESLGVLAGGIAHDFNNLLTPILGAAGLGLSELPEDSPVRARMHSIQQAAKRAALLTSQMLAYAGQSPLRIERLDLSKLVGEMRELVATSISGKTKFDLELTPGLPAIEGETAQLSQVVMNLITNAAESIRDGAGGRIAVRTRVADFDAPPEGAMFAETMAPGRHAVFEVEDTGCGMEEETLARIFDPFFTTKFTGRGLGLAAVAGIVRSHRGAIEVESEPGKGTLIRVLLPTVSEPVAEPTDNGGPIHDWRTSGTALVIDDDDAVRELAEDVLRRAGMNVLTATDGHEGVKLFGVHADSIRLVLLDRTMPTLSGANTFDAIRAFQPDAKILLVSGYSEERATAEIGGDGLAGFLQKPFTPASLLRRVREILESDPER